ncbi:MFS transporter [Streptomyces sp. NPDC059373]
MAVIDAKAAAPPAPTAAGAPGKLIAALVAGQFGVSTAILAPAIVTLSARIATVDPDNSAASLSLVAGVGAVLALISAPLFGALSDRTTSRFGRRRPWIIGGVLLGSIGLLLIATSTAIPVIAFGWALAQLGINASTASITAVIPDLVPEHQRGRVSGVFSMMLNVAIVAGSLLANAFIDSQVAMFMVPAAMGVAGAAFLVWALKGLDKPADKAGVQRYTVKEFAGSFWVNPVKHKDFAWNWAGRFLLMTGALSVSSYQLYFLMGRFDCSIADAVAKMTLLTVVGTATTVLGATTGGWLSDRSGRRKPFVIAAAIVITGALVGYSTADTLSMLFVWAAISGLGQGLYFAVDIALSAKVLPDPAKAAQSMGVLNIANALPQSLIPMYAPLLLAVGSAESDNYTLLFLVGAVAALLGAGAMQLIRSAK